MQVDYSSLLRKTRPPAANSKPVQERQGMALWKGRWVPNFKRFKKVGTHIVYAVNMVSLLILLELSFDQLMIIWCCSFKQHTVYVSTLELTSSIETVWSQQISNFLVLIVRYDNTWAEQGYRLVDSRLSSLRRICARKLVGCELSGVDAWREREPVQEKTYFLSQFQSPRVGAWGVVYATGDPADLPGPWWQRAGVGNKGVTAEARSGRANTSQGGGEGYKLLA